MPKLPLTTSNIGTLSRYIADGSPAATAAQISPAVTAATATTGAATCNALAGVVTSEALTTAQNAIYTLTITNSLVAAADFVEATVEDGTNTQGTPMLGTVKAGAGSIVIKVINKHATAEALNGTLKVKFRVIKAGI